MGEYNSLKITRHLHKKFKQIKKYNFENLLIILCAIFIFSMGINKILNLEENNLSILKNSIIRLIYWLPILYLILTFSYFGRYLRWRSLLGFFSIGGWNKDDVISWFKGFALTASPAKIGEISRVRTINKSLGYPQKILLIVFFLERLFDALSVLVWILIIYPEFVIKNLQKFFENNFIFFLIFVVLISFIYLLNKFKKIIKNYWKFLELYLSEKKIIYLFINNLFISICFWGIEAMILWLLVYVLSPQSISKASAIGIYLFSGMAGVISGIPGGIGINEAATTILLQREGVSTLIALSISISRRLITIWSITILSILLSIPIKKQK